MDNDGRWREAYWTVDRVTVPSDDWLVVDIVDIQDTRFTGASIVPVNQWKPMKFEITINYGDDIPEANQGQQQGDRAVRAGIAGPRVRRRPP